MWSSCCWTWGFRLVCCYYLQCSGYCLQITQAKKKLTNGFWKNSNSCSSWMPQAYYVGHNGQISVQMAVSMGRNCLGLFSKSLLFDLWYYFWTVSSYTISVGHLLYHSLTKDIPIQRLIWDCICWQSRRCLSAETAVPHSWSLCSSAAAKACWCVKRACYYDTVNVAENSHVINNDNLTSTKHKNGLALRNNPSTL